jgi:hypothetical protein
MSTSQDRTRLQLPLKLQVDLVGNPGGSGSLRMIKSQCEQIRFGDVSPKHHRTLPCLGASLPRDASRRAGALIGILSQAPSSLEAPQSHLTKMPCVTDNGEVWTVTCKLTPQSDELLAVAVVR